MNLFKTDQLFEEAGRSPESCEKLIVRLKKWRRGFLINLIGTVVVVTGFCVWGLVLSTRAFNAIVAGNSHSPDTDLPFDASLVRMLTPMVLVFLVTQIIMIQHHDACLKLLLFMRAQQGLSSRRDARD